MPRDGLSRWTTAELKRELVRRDRTLASLVRRKGRLIAELRVVEARLADGIVVTVARGGRPPGRRTRPKNTTDLVTALSKALKGKQMSVTEAAQAVQAAGYRTHAATFRTIVNAALINSGAFKRVRWGVYTAK